MATMFASQLGATSSLLTLEKRSLRPRHGCKNLPGKASRKTVLSLRCYRLDQLDASPTQFSPFLPNLVAKIFGPAIFEASKLKVLFLGVDVDEHPERIPRIYTLTHSDITAKLTLAVSQRINEVQLQGWYRRLQRDDVVAKWTKSRGSMSLHVHCHISGDHWFLDAIAKLRFYIFRRELPVVLQAFRHGDQALFRKHPELEEAPVWVYFHSNVKEFNRLECWGSLGSQVGKEAEKTCNSYRSSPQTICSKITDGRTGRDVGHCCFIQGAKKLCTCSKQEETNNEDHVSEHHKLAS